jgi:hypothetical protein
MSVFLAAYEIQIDPSVFTGLAQTYLVTRNEAGHVQTRIGHDAEPTNPDVTSDFAEVEPDEGFHFVELGSNSNVANFDFESVYLLAWQTPSVTATLTGLTEGSPIGSVIVEVGNDPTQVKVDWDVIDVLAISYTGMPGFPVTDNFLLL